MSEAEVLRLVAKLRDDVSGPLSRIERAVRHVGKTGGEQNKQMREGFRAVHDQLRKVADVSKAAVAPALDEIGIASLSAVGAVALLTSQLKTFADQGADVAAFGRKVQLTTDTIRGLEGVAEKFHVDPAAIRQGEQSFSDAMFLIRRRRGELYAHLLAQRRDIATELSATPETVEGNEKALGIFLKLIDDIKKPGSHGEPTARMFSKEVFGTDAFVDLLRNGNAGLADAVKLTLQLRGNMDTEAGERWIENWSDFKATIEGVRNVVGNELLPDLTETAREAGKFFVANRVQIGHDIADTIHGIATALKEVDEGVQFVGGWKIVFEGLLALKLLSLATRITKVGGALGALVGLGSPPGWVLALLGVSAVGAVATAGAVRNMTPEARQSLYMDPGMATMNPDLAMLAAVTDQAHRISLRRLPIGSRAGEILKGLRDRGLDASHAAILGGNIEQESNFDPTKPNIAEGGIGLIQWRLERRAALQRLAHLRHKAETDAGVQMDYLLNELKDTPEGRAFLAAQSPEQMNAALHDFIRYGDNSQDRRLFYGRRLLPLAENPAPGALLAGANKNGLGASPQTVTGSASIKVDVNAPRGTTVKATADGLFDDIEVNRGLAMEGTGL